MNDPLRNDDDDERLLDEAFYVARERVLDRFERAYLAALMKRCGGNVSMAARMSGLYRAQLRTLLRRRGLYVRQDPAQDGDEDERRVARISDVVPLDPG